VRVYREQCAGGEGERPAKRQFRDVKLLPPGIVLHGAVLLGLETSGHAAEVTGTRRNVSAECVSECVSE
jgi:hypothetical protein